MRRTIAGLGLLALLLTAEPLAAQEANVDGGTLTGATKDGVSSFLGIPYAAPPVGELRWRAPQPVVAWAGVRDATKFGTQCEQDVVHDDAAPVDGPLSEDCLFLNVWTPFSMPPVAATGLLPVMVWIHGGGFLNGGSSAPIFDGAALAQQGIVVVTLNYRLGRLGFFAHPALLELQPGEVGNFGIMDQIAALKWVQANIAAFGGDPAKVTVVGESAGGGSVLILITSPKTTGLFRGAMIMSGGGRDALLSRNMTEGKLLNPSSQDEDAAYAKILGVPTTTADAIAAMRALPPESFVKGWNLPALLQQAIAEFSPNYSGTPMIDGSIIAGNPQAIFLANNEAPVPVVIGTTAIDIPLLFPPRLIPFGYFGDDGDAARDAYNPDDTATLPEVLLSIGSDITMHEPSRFVAREVTAAGRRAWLYRYTYVAEKEPNRGLGAAHAREVPFLFDNAAARYPDTVTDNDRRAGHQFSGYLVNFVKNGDPNGPGLPEWPKFDPGKYDLMNFTLDDGPVFGPDPRNPRVELVEHQADAAAAK